MRVMICCIILSLGFQMCSQGDVSRPKAAKSVKLELNDKEKLLKEIEALEQDLRKRSEQKLDKTTALELIKKSEVFAEAYPKDPQTPAILFRTADVARGIGEFGKAIKHWGTVYNEYSNFERAPDAEFMIGFTYENFLQDKEQAKRYYIRFLKKYPDHTLVPQVEAILKNIDKTPEELVREFQQKNPDRQ